MTAFAEISQVSPAMFRRFSDVIGDSADLARRFESAVDALPPGRRLELARNVPEPSGLQRAAGYCGRNSCVGNIVRLAGLGLAGYVTVRLMQLNDNERECLNACLPQSEVNETPVRPNELNTEQRRSGMIVCDGTEATGTTWTECQKYCEINCTSMKSKCNFLGIAPACDLTGGLTNVLGTLVNDLFKSLGLGEIGKIVKYAILGVVGLVLLVVLIKVLTTVFRPSGAAAAAKG
jgi:hypothetical protein